MEMGFHPCLGIPRWKRSGLRPTVNAPLNNKQYDWSIRRIPGAGRMVVNLGCEPSHSLLKSEKISARSSFEAMAGPQCCTSGPEAQHCCVGKEESFGPFLSYISTPTKPTAAVIFINDVFGFDAPLLRKLADKTATAGYFVVVPDVFHKDPFRPAEGSDPMARFGDWIKNHQALDSVAGVEQVVDALHKKGFSSVGAIGFCWGAKVVVQIAKGHSLKAAVIAHPSFVTVDDIQEVKTPIAILASEIDNITPPAVAQKFAEVLASKPEVESFVHVYPGVAHGWTCRYDPDDPKAVANAEEAHKKIYEWFGKFLLPSDSRI